MPPAATRAPQITGYEKTSKAKRLKINSALKSSAWDEHAVDFTGSNISQELQGFITTIDDIAASPNAERFAMLSRLSDMPKLEVMEALIGPEYRSVRHDLVICERLEDLHQYLCKPFQQPILHRASGQPERRFGLPTLLSTLHPGHAASVYDCSIDDSTLRTRSTSAQELISTFAPARGRSSGAAPLNFLDIENRTGISFCPLAVKLTDVQTTARARAPASTTTNIGKTDSEWRPPAAAAKEFFIASTRNAVSTIHVDTAGSNTWVTVLDGSKVWYFARCADDAAVLRLASAGAVEPAHYPHGWVKVELHVGDTLIMPPGLPHAVYTPEDCLLAGGVFYTAANLGCSLQALSLQERYPHISNESMSDAAYVSLAEVFDSYDGNATEAQKASVVSYSLNVPDSGASNACLKKLLSDAGVKYNGSLKKKDLMVLLAGYDGRVLSGRDAFEAIGAMDGFRLSVELAMVRAERKQSSLQRIL